MKHTLYQTKSKNSLDSAIDSLDIASREATRYYMQFMTESEQEEFISTLI